MTNLLSYAIIIDMMKREYEIISHAETNFKVFVVNLLYRAPHIHKDFELGLVLDGNISILLPGQTLLLQPGDFWLINPFQSHEIKADKPALLLSLQVSSAFFAPYYPEIDHLEFISCVLSASADMQYRTLFSDMTALALAYFQKALRSAAPVWSTPAFSPCCSFCRTILFPIRNHSCSMKMPDAPEASPSILNSMQEKSCCFPILQHVKIFPCTTFPICSRKHSECPSRRICSKYAVKMPDGFCS